MKQATWRALTADDSFSKGPAKRLECQIPIKSQKKWEHREDKWGGWEEGSLRWILSGPLTPLA